MHSKKLRSRGKLNPRPQLWYHTRRTSFVSPTIKHKLYGRGEETFYAIVQHSPSYVQAAASGAACSRSDATMHAGPADASKGGMCAAENYMTGANWTQDIGSDTMLDDTSSVNPTIKLRWYGMDEGDSYAIVQRSSSYVRVIDVGVTCSRSGAAVPVGPVDASEGGICAVKNCVAMGNWTQYIGSDIILENPTLISPTIKHRWYGMGEGAAYAIV
jgi:hypothetical protein